MKKLVAFILALYVMLSLVGCADQLPEETVKDIESVISEVIDGIEELETADYLPEIDFDDFSSVEDFLDKAGILLEETKIDENTLVVDMKTPDKDDGQKPAVPVIDKVTKPDSAPDTTEETESAPDNTADTESAEKDESAEESEPAPEITPEPEKEPEPTPEPAPEPTPEPELTPEPVKPAEPAYTYTTGQKHTALKTEEKYIYSILDETSKKYYRTIDDAVRNMRDSASFDVRMSENRRYYVYFLYMCDNPELWYLGNTMTLCNHSNGTSSIEFSYSDGTNYNAYGRENRYLTAELRESILKKDALFKTEVERIVSTIPADAPDVWKERLIYDRILMDSYYNLGARWNGVCEDNWNAYGILVNKYGVCESYAEALHTLLDAVGIVSTDVVGTAGGGHKWSAVRLDGEWYMCDITFDDPIGGEQGAAYHYYFNRTSAEMSKDGHEWSNCDWKVPDCLGTKYSFKNYFGDSYY